jgi:hypothetical protein
MSLHPLSTTELEKFLPTYRDSLRNVPEALETLDILEDYEFEAGRSLYAIWQNIPDNRGQERGKVDELLKKRITEVKRIFCGDQHSKQLLASSLVGPIAGALELVIQSSIGIPPGLATGLLIYIASIGVEEFCGN